MKRGAIEQLILLGDKQLAVKWVAFVRHKAIDFARQLTRGACLNHKVPLPNGWAKIQVADGRRKLIIYCEGGALSYEFFTSELIEPYYVYTPPYDGTSNNFSVCGKGSFHQFRGSWKSTPLVNLCHNCNDAGPPDPGEEALSYPLMNCNTNVGLDSMKSPDYWDVLKFQKQFWYPGWRGDKFVTCGLDVVPYNKRNQMLSWINARVDFLPGGGFGWRLFANGFAEPPKVWNWDGYTPIAQGGPTRGVGDYFYGGCVRSSGNHQIVIMVDGNGKFYAWEAGDYSVTPPARIETVTPSYDPVIETGFSTFQFSSDATKAVATCIEYRQSRKDKDNNDVYKALQGTFLGLDYGSGNVGSGYGGSKRLAQEDLPVLVEVSLNVWEDEFGEWQFSVTLEKETKYDTLQEWIIAADYIEDVPGFERGTLVALFNELYYDPTDGYMVGVSPHFPENYNTAFSRAIVFKYFDTDTQTWQEIRRFAMTTGITQFYSIPAVNDPYGNPQAGLGFSTISNGGSGLLPLHDAQINALNLKTLSLSLYKFQRLNPNGTTSSTEANGQRLEVWAYNQLAHTEEKYDSTHGVMTFDFGWPVSGHIKLPYNLYEVQAGNAASMFEPKYRGQFTYHPKGHWAINNVILPIPDFQQSADDFFMLDVIKLANGQKFKHQDLYNSAFTDTRQVSYYNDEDDYRGVFMTAGIWRDK